MKSLFLYSNNWFEFDFLVYSGLGIMLGFGPLGIVMLIGPFAFSLRAK